MPGIPVPLDKPASLTYARALAPARTTKARAHTPSPPCASCIPAMRAAIFKRPAIRGSSHLTGRAPRPAPSIEGTAPMSLSEARRFADAPFALHLAPDARIAKAAAALAKSDKPEDDERKRRVSAEQITRLWEKATSI